MNDEAFLNMIRATPEDDALRLAYADWLEGQGQPSALFLRAECKLASLSPEGDAWHDAFSTFVTVGQTLALDWRKAVARSPEYWLAVAVRRAWTRLEDWCREHQSGLLRLLRPGASMAEIKAVETAIGHRLPVDVRESLAIHNGCESLILGDDLLSTAEMIEEWQAWRGLEEYNDEVRGGMTSVPEEAIALDYSNAGWIPLTRIPGTSNFLGVDLVPEREGGVGQVINFGRDEELKGVLASSWCQFLADYATFLASGAILSPNLEVEGNWRDACIKVFGDRSHHVAWWERRGGRG